MQHYVAWEIIQQRTSEMRTQAQQARQAREARQARKARQAREEVRRSAARHAQEAERSGAAGREQVAVPETVPLQRVPGDADAALCGTGPRSHAC
jgi:hypothetical protein